MPTLFLDLETYSEINLKTHGLHRYAEAAEVLLIGTAWDEAPAEVIEASTDALLDLCDDIDKADRIVIQNSAFDRTILAHQGISVPVEKIYDTMVQALAHSLPAALEILCPVIRVPFDQQKDKDGKKLIQLFCKPQAKNRKVRRPTKETHPAEWAQFVEYCRQDIVAMREVFKRLPRWNYTPFERTLWHIDQAINDRGVAIDLELARAATRAAADASAVLSARADVMTGGEVQSLAQRDKLMEHLEGEHGVFMDDLRRGTVAATLKEGGLSEEVQELLENRLQASATSPAKYGVLLRATNTDGRLRGTLQFCGASRTGRWGGRLFQPQNLPRPTLKCDEVDMAIEAMKLGCESMLFSNVMELCQNAIRGTLVAGEGKKLVVSDLSNIEGRVLAWLAGEEWKLEAYRAYDAGTGPDLYLLTAGEVLGKPHTEVTKKERQSHGKVAELALGYQGALNAFNSMAAAYGVSLSDERVIEIVKAWRRANPKIVNFWYAVENNVRAVIFNPAERIEMERGITIDMEGTWLRIRLPSGRYLCYPATKIVGDNITYAGTNQYVRPWGRLTTYGGKIVENIVQAVARDTLACGMRRAEAHGYPVVMHVHDELITEVPDGDGYTARKLSGLMSQVPGWAHGLPLAAAGFETYRYRKDG
jgi:DNA polymerase